MTQGIHIVWLPGIFRVCPHPCNSCTMGNKTVFGDELILFVSGWTVVIPDTCICHGISFPISKLCQELPKNLDTHM